MAIITRSSTGSIPNAGHLIISNALVADKILLYEFTTEAPTAYQREKAEHITADGRSLVGSLKVKGRFLSAARPVIARCNFLASAAQVNLFEQLLNAQPGNTSYLEDYWEQPIAAPLLPVFINVAERYRSRIRQDWYNLQFELLEA